MLGVWRSVLDGHDGLAWLGKNTRMKRMQKIRVMVQLAKNDAGLMLVEACLRYLPSLLP